MRACSEGRQGSGGAGGTLVEGRAAVSVAESRGRCPASPSERSAACGGCNEGCAVCWWPAVPTRACSEMLDVWRDLQAVDSDIWSLSCKLMRCVGRRVLRSEQRNPLTCAIVGLLAVVILFDCCSRLGVCFGLPCLSSIYFCKQRADSEPCGSTRPLHGFWQSTSVWLHVPERSSRQPHTCRCIRIQDGALGRCVAWTHRLSCCRSSVCCVCPRR